MKILTPIKAIRARCLDCCGYSAAEVKLCTAVNCPLYPYRMGHRPKKGNLSDNTSQAEKCEDNPTFFEKERGLHNG